MKKVLIFLIFFLFYGCNKPKTVFICGDHICVNKKEAEQYFEDNLVLEVKVIDKKKEKQLNLVELNMRDEENGKKISIIRKKNTKKKIKVLSKEEVIKKKAQLKNRNKNKKKKKAKFKKNIKATKKDKSEEVALVKKTVKKTVNKSSNKIVDICTILTKCSIDEISKYLLKKGSQKDFPDITARE